ncbi:hypothetical protein ACFL51_02020, partial [Myxococcota bacterium]
PTHCVQLLPLQDKVSTIDKLAQQAKKKGWTVRQLKEEVGKKLDKMPKDTRGRPPDPDIVKVLKASTRAIEATAGTWQQNARDLNSDQLSDSIATAKALMEELEKMISALEKVGG